MQTVDMARPIHQAQSVFLPAPETAAEAPPLSQLMAQTLDLLSYGIILVDAELKPILTNSTALRFLREGRLPLSRTATRHRADPLA